MVKKKAENDGWTLLSIFVIGIALGFIMNGLMCKQSPTQIETTVRDTIIVTDTCCITDTVEKPVIQYIYPHHKNKVDTVIKTNIVRHSDTILKIDTIIIQNDMGTSGYLEVSPTGHIKPITGCQIHKWHQRVFTRPFPLYRWPDDSGVWRYIYTPYSF
jgi:hypothetical protein